MVGVVIPTLFRRNDYLLACISSVRAAGNTYILLMGPQSSNSRNFTDLADDFIEEPSEGTLSAKIDFAMRSLPKNLEYITWIGDDDLLEEGSMDRATAILDSNPEAVMTFGACRYIDAQGKQIGINKSGRWAVWLMKFGPFLAPQPGSLYRRFAYENCGGLDSSYSLAFDYDLAMNLKVQGDILYLPFFQASYRWHQDALSVGQRGRSVQEAQLVRIKHSSGLARVIVAAVNPIVSVTTQIAGLLLARNNFGNR